MKLTKEVVIAALENVFLPNEEQNIVESGAIKNIQLFDSDVELDVEIKNPTLQYKKKVEVDCLKAIHDYAYEKSKVKVNLIVNVPVKENLIKGSPIPGVKNIIAVSSGKGGVGKSTITANLAVGLSHLGYKVGVIDADIYGPSMHIMFGLEGESPLTVSVEGKSKIKPLESYGVKLLSIGFFAQSQQAVVWRGPMASKALNQLLWDTHWGELDYLIVDLPLILLLPIAFSNIKSEADPKELFSLTRIDVSTKNSSLVYRLYRKAIEKVNNKLNTKKRQLLIILKKNCLTSTISSN